MAIYVYLSNLMDILNRLLSLIDSIIGLNKFEDLPSVFSPKGSL